MNAKQQANADRAKNTKAIVDQTTGYISYGNYSIEFWDNSKTFSIYSKFDSMYDCKDGFEDVTSAISYIDKYR